MKGKKMQIDRIRSVIQRLKNGQAIRHIHDELRVHRTKIREISSVAITRQWLDPDSPMPSNEEIVIALDLKKEVKPHLLDLHQEKLKEWHETGLTAVVMQRLLIDTANYDIQQIRRYCAKNFPIPVDPVMIRSTAPGKAADVDFGELGFFLDHDGNRKKYWFFSLRLRHSRKAYREVVDNQSAETFCMCHVRAFEYLGGVSLEVWIDCLKAGVIKSVIDNDQVNRMYQSLAERYGFVICPCLPRTPEHKGGVESDVKYTKNNCLAYFKAKQKMMSITIPKIQDFIEYLQEWGETVADIHIIQGVGRSPKDLFQSEERACLKPLPKNRWEPIRWAVCKVERGWRIRYETAFYAVPYQLIGKKVDVCITSTMVSIFDDNKQIVIYEKATKKWEYKRKAEFAPPFKEAVLQCSKEGLLELAQELGEFIYKLSFKILSEPTTDKLRPVRHLLNLKDAYSKERLESACKRAFECKLFSYASVKNILIKNLDSEESKEKDEKSSPKPSQEPSRFERDPKSYKSSYQNSSDKEAAQNSETRAPKTYRKETYQELLKRTHSVSKHGNAMWGPEIMMALDREDEELKKQGLKTKWELLQENYAEYAAKEKAAKEEAAQNLTRTLLEQTKEPPMEAQNETKKPLYK